MATAKLRAGEIARMIMESGRNALIPEPPWQEVFDVGLLLQAGLRALLPVGERDGVSLPGEPSSQDTPLLQEAQRNYKEVFESKNQATEAQKQKALKIVALATEQLERQGYMSLSGAIKDWLKAQGYSS